MSNKKTVWIKKKLLDSESEFILVERCVVNTMRKEYRNLGAASLTILTQNADTTLQQLSLPVEGDWIFVVAGEDPPQDIFDNRIKWWGYIDGSGLEYSRGLSDVRGDISALEFGHWVKKQLVKYPKPFMYFNPIDSNNVLLGNRFSTTIRLSDIGTSILSQKNTHYWNTLQMVEYVLSHITGDLSYGVDISRIDPKKVGTIESVESGHLEDPILVLDRILDRLVYRFELQSTASISLVIIDPARSTTELSLIVPDDSASLHITRQDDRYNSVKLIGDRIQINWSSSTFEPESNFVGVARDWTEDDEYFMVQPDPDVPPIQDLIENDAWQTVIPGATEKSLTIGAITRNMQQIRSRNKRAYQQYKWKYGDTELTGGNKLLTRANPGSINDVQSFPVFGEVKFLTLLDGSANPAPFPTIDNTIDYTPASTDMEWVDQIQPEGDVPRFISPTFYYRTLSNYKNYDSETYWIPDWTDGTNPYFAGISATMRTDWRGIQIEFPYPEALASSSDDLFKDWVGGSFTAVEDFGLRRFEWQTDEKSASEYDPEYFGSDANDSTRKFGCGHWGRIVFSLGAKSAQHLELIRDDSNGQEIKELLVVDPSFQIVINRKGFVKGVRKSTQSPNEASQLIYTQQDEFVRNDTPQAVEYLDELWEYHGKRKAAVRFERRITNENFDEESIEQSLNIGDYFKTINDNGKIQEINSAVASIEWIFEGASPRVIVQTEYPASPVNTRNRKQRFKV